MINIHAFSISVTYFRQKIWNESILAENLQLNGYFLSRTKSKSEILKCWKTFKTEMWNFKRKCKYFIFSFSAWIRLEILFFLLSRLFLSVFNERFIIQEECNNSYKRKFTFQYIIEIWHSNKKLISFRFVFRIGGILFQYDANFDLVPYVSHGRI